MLKADWGLGGLERRLRGGGYCTRLGGAGERIGEVSHKI